MAKNQKISFVSLNKSIGIIIPCLIGVFLALFPTPSGVDPRAYPMLGVFTALIIGILFKPYPITVLALFGLFAAMAFRLVSVKDGLAAFGESIIWLIAFASVAAKSFTKTNLGQRMACFFIKQTGRHSLGLAYGLMLNECVFSPMIPSNTARAACISIPLTVSVSESLGSSPKDHTQGRIGRFLSLCNLHANQLSSALFLTAMGSNPLIQKFMGDLGLHITWGEWFLMACVPCLLCMLAVPLMMYKLAPPELRKIPQAAEVAQKKLDSMPPMDRKEITTIFVFLTMLTLWIIGGSFTPAFVALGGLCVLLVTEVLDLEDITGAKSVWSIVMWLSILNFLASKLTEFGLIRHYASILNTVLSGHSWPLVLVVISIIYFYARYLIPGNIMHACAMFPAFSQILIACGVPAKMGCMVLGFITAYCGFVTPYATSPCPIIYNTGYITQKLWWKVGIISGIVYFLIWGIFGGLWWKFLGCY